MNYGYGYNYGLNQYQNTPWTGWTGLGGVSSPTGTGNISPFFSIAGPAPSQKAKKPKTTKQETSFPPMTLPTGPEMFQNLMGLSPFQSQTNILSQMGSPTAFQAAVRPQIQSVMKAIGRSGLPSSSYADRLISNTLGDLWQRWQLNTLSGWQNVMRTMQPWLQSFYLPYQMMFPMFGGIG
jgi:hypothetical protein